MIDLSKYRVIDLSYELLPGEGKIDGHYLHGEPFHGQSVQVQEFMAFSARMHFIQSETHNGTHVESAHKYSEDGADIGSMLVESYMGEAVVSATRPLAPPSARGTATASCCWPGSPTWTRCSACAR
jgi:kynurenine formamidase